MAKKWYVVWEGHVPGVYESWNECKLQIEHFPAAKYKGYPSLEQAQEAYEDGYEVYQRKKKEGALYAHSTASVEDPAYILNSYCVDAACSGNPGPMEYRGVHTYARTQIFHFGPIMGTNNIGEFLAIVHALALQKQQRTNLPIYSDSATAIKWIRDKKCRTKLPQIATFEHAHTLIQRAEFWLRNNPIEVPILKWNTLEWGEIPADFGRKK